MGLKIGIGIGLNIFVVLLMACFKKFSKKFFSKKNVESYYHYYYIQKNIEHLLSSKKTKYSMANIFCLCFCIYYYGSKCIYVCI